MIAKNNNCYLRMSVCLHRDNEKIDPVVPVQVFKAGVDCKGKTHKTIAREKSSNS